MWKILIYWSIIDINFAMVQFKIFFAMIVDKNSFLEIVLIKKEYLVKNNYYSEYKLKFVSFILMF
jgi:hypothetical protein